MKTLKVTQKISEENLYQPTNKFIAAPFSISIVVNTILYWKFFQLMEN
jgi:hypothetical protein